MVLMKILLVEDSPDIANIYSFNLESEGHSVEVASTGAVALQKVLTFEPEVILLDVLLPDMDGILVLQKIRTDPQFSHLKPRILITSNMLQDDIAEKAKFYKAEGYYVKADLHNQDLVNIMEELSKRIKFNNGDG